MTACCRSMPTFKSRLVASEVICQRPATFDDRPEHGCLFRRRFIAILQNGGIQSCFYASVVHGRMPTMDPETIGGISTGFTSYPERLCVPPYSQNSATADLYSQINASGNDSDDIMSQMIVHANNASGSEIADNEKGT